CGALLRVRRLELHDRRDSPCRRRAPVGLSPADGSVGAGVPLGSSFGRQMSLSSKTKNRTGVRMAPSPKVGDLLQNATLSGEWNLDPSKSKVIFRTRHTFNLLPLTGVFEKVSGHGTVSTEG